MNFSNGMESNSQVRKEVMAARKFRLKFRKVFRSLSKYERKQDHNAYHCAEQRIRRLLRELEGNAKDGVKVNAVICGY